MAHGHNADGDASGELLGGFATTLGVWAVFAWQLVNLDRRTPSPTETTRDRKAGITPSKITCGTHSSRDTR